MSDDTVTIEVDGVSLEARKGQMLIEVTDANDNYVPRFCYHNKLSVAANCRMCLVEVEKAPKPLPACATPVMDGMKVFTKSKLALEAQKSVMEFLLINHPLDCPICDQGGECELQDLAMGYGSDVSRYQESKRVVKDKNIGPLVQTEMTRCIHCTRCVRFGEEIAGLPELGATGRGEHMEIGTYVEKSMVSEMSGNVIDLCPVGALTSKPFRFSARTWEMSQHDGIAPHDAVGSNLHFHVKGDIVKRVVPAENEAINEVWLSDRDRFSYEGLYSEDRLQLPMIKQDGVWKEVDWETAFDAVKEGLNAVIQSAGAEKIGALVSPTATTEEAYLLQKLIRALGSNNIDHRLRQSDFSDQDIAPTFPYLGQAIADIQGLNAALIIGGYPRKEQPILNHRLRKAALKGADIMFISALDHESNFDVAEKVVVSPNKLVEELAGVVKALLVSNPDEELVGLLASVSVNDTHKAMAEKLKAANGKAIFIGNTATSHPQFSTIRYLSGKLAELTGANVGYLGEATNSAGVALAGALPHREANGAVSNKTGLNALEMLEEELAAFLLFNIEPGLDSINGRLARLAMQSAQCVIAITPYKSAELEEYAHVLLPMALYAENTGSYINVEGKRQSFRGIVSAPGEARPAWKILKVLADNFELTDFSYNTFDDLAAELTEKLGDIQVDNFGASRKPDSMPTSNGALQRMTIVPMNSVDTLIRRAVSLQQTTDIADGSVHINQALAEKIGVSAQDRVKAQQEDISIELAVVIDDSVAEQTVLIHGAHTNSAQLGPWYGDISLSKA